MDTNNTNQSSSTSPELTIPPEVRSFLEGILTDANMATLDDEMREEMVKELFVRLDTFLTSKIVESLPPEHMEAFMQLVEEKKSQEEIQKFLQERMPNSGEVFANAFGEFRDMYLRNVVFSRQAPSGDDSKQQ